MFVCQFSQQKVGTAFYNWGLKTKRFNLVVRKIEIVGVWQFQVVYHVRFIYIKIVIIMFCSFFAIIIPPIWPLLIGSEFSADQGDPFRPSLEASMVGSWSDGHEV